MFTDELPHHASPFVGRGADIAQIAALLANPACRLLTLTGPGGAGKTRLAIESAARRSADFRDGIYFISLQPLTSAKSIVFAIAEGLRLALAGQDTPEAQVCGYLEGQAVLLVLDCFEHLLDGTNLVSRILANTQNVKVLTTSREVLNLQEEWLYPVAGLQCPPSVYSLDAGEYDAVQLFVQHAQRLQPQFSLDQEVEGVIRLCRLSEGMPLAIELAAAWVKALPALQIAEEMQRNLDFLATQFRDVPQRHRSLRAVFDHSWQQLSDDERQVFARLSVFRGGFGTEAAEAIAGASLRHLLGLTDKSFLHKTAAGRFDSHELLRQFAAEQLQLLDPGDKTRARHAQYFASLMQRCEAAIKSSAQLGALQQIENDFDNIQTAWSWAAQKPDAEVLNAMLEGLYQFGFIRGRYREMADIFQRTLERLDRPTNLATPLEPLVGRVLARRWGYLHWWYQVDYQVALDSVERATRIAMAQGESFEISFCQLMRGYVAISNLDYNEALPFLEQGRIGFHRLNEPFYEAWALHRIGYAHSNLAHNDEFVIVTEQSLALARQSHNLSAIANCLYNLGAEYLMASDFQKAHSYFEDAREIARQLGHRGQTAHAISLVALSAFCLEDYEQAGRMADEGRRLGRETNILTFEAYPLSVSIVLACLKEDYAEAERLDRMGQPYRTNDMGYRLIDWALATLACGLDQHQAAWQYVHEALNLRGPLGSAATTQWIFPSAAWVLADTRPIQAVQLLGWLAVHAAGNTGLAWVERWPPVPRLRARLEAQLDGDLFQAAWQQGASLAFETLVAELLVAFRPVTKITETSAALPELLTHRELEVLEFMALGLTNPQIAARLVIGAGTVKTYTLAIYRKLDVSNRTQAVQRARELRLLPA